MRKFVSGLVIGAVISTAIGSFATGVWENIPVLKNDIKVVVDGQEIQADNFLYNDTTYLPIRTVSEALGKNVEYDESTNIAYVGERNDIMNSININKHTPPEDIINNDIFIHTVKGRYIACTDCICKYVNPLDIELSYTDDNQFWIFLKDGEEIYRYPCVFDLGIYYDDLIDIVIPALKERLGLN